MRVTAKKAKNRLGNLCNRAKRGPVLVEKAGPIDTVILAAEPNEAMRSAREAGLDARKKAFEAEYGDWIAAQNTRFETHGIPGADLRPW